MTYCKVQNQDNAPGMLVGFYAQIDSHFGIFFPDCVFASKTKTGHPNGWQ
jgi:hypothetical protein